MGCGDCVVADRKAHDRHHRRTLFRSFCSLPILDFIRRLRRLSPAQRNEIVRMLGTVFLRNWLRWSVCGGVLRMCVPPGGEVERLAGCRPVHFPEWGRRSHNSTRDASITFVLASSASSNVEGVPRESGQAGPTASIIQRFAVSSLVLVLMMVAAFTSLLIFAAAWAS